MTNDLKNFLDGQVRKFCSEADDSMFPVELDKSYTEVVNFVLDLMEKEVEKPEVASGIMLDQRGRKWVELKDLKTIINNLRV